MSTDTKAYWRRRALRAEAELETLHRIRATDHSVEMTMHRQLGALVTGMREIQQIINDTNEAMR